jgi:nucleoside-diphosphate-sugar epimerase
MKILVIGGTRLLGLALVKALVAARHHVTVVSRRAENCPPGVESLPGDRQEGLRQLAGRRFDATFDFIAYDGLAPPQVFAEVHYGAYVLISSTWMVRLNGAMTADQAVTNVEDGCLDVLHPLTRKYLLGKLAAEEVVLAERAGGGAATILRLPIFWGARDHTGRLNFYRQRLADGGPVICVDGGLNVAQILWTEDVARVILNWLPRASERPVWEAMPDEGKRVREVIALIARGMHLQESLVDISSETLEDLLPEYLQTEPLWREREIAQTESNLFLCMKMRQTPPSIWLCDLAGQGPVPPESPLRQRELSLIQSLAYDRKSE